MPSPGLQRIALIPDTHSPYEDKRAWRITMKAVKAFAPDILIHLGDLADFYSVSSHSKDPARALGLKAELQKVRELRAEMDRLGAKRKIFICGNHEDRLRRYLQDKAPELFGLVSADDLLELGKNGWEFVPYKQSIRVGKLYVTHDVGTSGKYSTARALETFQHSVAIGHHHAIQYHVAGDATGQHQLGIQVGWLGDVDQVDYMHRVKAKRTWSLGFGVGYLDPGSGRVYLTPCPIVSYTACVEGKVYRA